MFLGGIRPDSSSWCCMRSIGILVAGVHCDEESPAKSIYREEPDESSSRLVLAMVDGAHIMGE